MVVWIRFSSNHHNPSLRLPEEETGEKPQIPAFPWGGSKLDCMSKFSKFCMDFVLWEIITPGKNIALVLPNERSKKIKPSGVSYLYPRTKLKNIYGNTKYPVPNKVNSQYLAFNKNLASKQRSRKIWSIMRKTKLIKTTLEMTYIRVIRQGH